MTVTCDDIERLLSHCAAPLSVSEIAGQLGCEVGECEGILWDNPQRFVWQPGYKWMLASVKSHVPRAKSKDTTPDVRANAISRGLPRELRALMLSSGVVMSVARRPLDSDAFFTSRSAGNTITMTLNSTHELFINMPMLFDDDQDQSPFKKMCEILLGAWALYEDSLSSAPLKRAAEDARLLWGRRVIEVLQEMGDD